MTAHVESQKQKVHKEILFRASKNPLKIPLREEAATRRPLRGGVHTDVLDASLPSPPARALTAQGERTSRRMYGDFHAHGHGGHSEPISEFSRHREVVLLRGWTWSRDALSGDTRRPRTHFQVIF